MLCQLRRLPASMLFKTQSAAVYGIDANIIEVEVDVSPSRDPKENFQTVGLPDTAVKESRQRISAALRNCGTSYPQFRNAALIRCRLSFTAVSGSPTVWKFSLG